MSCSSYRDWPVFALSKILPGPLKHWQWFTKGTKFLTSVKTFTGIYGIYRIYGQEDEFYRFINHRMHSLIIHYFVSYKPLGYFLTFVGLLIEGDLVLFTAAFLTHQGIFDLGNMLIVVLSGVLAGDMAWYLIGTRLNGTHYWWQRWFSMLTKPFDRHILTRPFHTIFLSKFAYGLHRATLVRAGMLKVARSDFLKADLVAALLWIVIIGGLGYGASISFLLFKHYLHFVEIGLLFALIVFFLLSHLYAHYIRKEL